MRKLRGRERKQKRLKREGRREGGREGGGVTSQVLTQPVVVAHPLGGEPLHTYDGIPQGDPLSTLIFAAAMTLAITGALGDGTAVRNVSCIDDTLLMGSADEVADAHDRLAARLRPTDLELQPTKTKVWAPNQEHLMADPRPAHIHRLVLGAPPFVHEHLRKVANLISQDCVKVQHPPEHLVAQEAGMQLGFALLQRALPSRILHLRLLRG